MQYGIRIRKVAVMLAIIVLFESIPWGEFRIKAEIYDDWTEVTAEAGNVMKAVYGNGLWLILDEDGHFKYSEDGKEWTESECMLKDVAPNTSAFEVCIKYLEGYFYLYGNAGVFLRTLDGQVWEDISFSEAKVCDVVYGNGCFYASTGLNIMASSYYENKENGNIFKSENGQDWELLISETHASGEIWLAAGSDMVIARDLFQGHVYVFDAEGNFIEDIEIVKELIGNYSSFLVYKEGVFLCGFSNAVFTSTDGIQWRRLGNCLIETQKIQNSIVESESEIYMITGDYDKKMLAFQVENGNVFWNRYSLPQESDLYELICDGENLYVMGKNKIFMKGLSSEQGGEDLNSPLMITSEINEFRNAVYTTMDQVIAIEGNVMVDDCEIQTGEGKLIIQGDLTVSGKTIFNGSIEVRGDLIVNGMLLTMEHANVIIGGDLCTSPENVCYGIEMQHEDDRITVEGDLRYEACYSSRKINGEIAVKGNLTLGPGFRAGENHCLLLTGSERQTVNVDENAQIGTLKLGNTSGMSTLFYGRKREDCCYRIEYMEDTADPETPKDIKVSIVSTKGIHLSWGESDDDSGIKGYRVYRDNNLLEELCEKPDYYDPIEEGSYTYEIVAVDLFDKESPKSEPFVYEYTKPGFEIKYPVEGEILGKKASLYAVMNGMTGAHGEKMQFYWSSKDSDVRRPINEEGEDLYCYNGITSASDSWTLPGEMKDEDIDIFFVFTDYDGGNIEKSVTCHVDRIPPENITHLAAEDGDQKVNLSWAGSISEDLTASPYKIYRRVQGEEKYSLLCSDCYQTTYTDYYVKDGFTYEYAIQTIDKYGNLSDYSEPVSVFVSPDQQLPVITNSYLGNGGRQKNKINLTFSATDNRGVSSFLVELTKEDGESKQIPVAVRYVSTSVSSDYTLVTSDYEDGAYILSVCALDKAGNQSIAVKNPLYIDNTGPVAPIVMEGEITTTQIDFSWESPEEDILSSYLYEVLENGKRRYLTGGSSNRYTVKNLKPEQTVRFVLYATDKLGNTGEEREFSFTTLPDMERPATITGVAVQKITGSRIGLLWNRGQDNIGVIGYRIYRDGSLIGTTDGLYSNSYSDTGVSQEVSYTYQVTAVDEAGNESELSEPITVKTAMPVISEFMPADGAIIGGKTLLSFSVPGGYVHGYRKAVLEYYDEEQSQWIQIYQKNQMYQWDDTLLIRDEYPWNSAFVSKQDSVKVRIKVSDEDGNESITERTYKISQEVPILPDLQINAEDGVVDLSWKSVSEDSVVYRIYKRSLDGNANRTFSLLKEFSQWQNEYEITDKNVEWQKNYEYYLEVENELGNQSCSDPVTVSPQKDITPPSSPENLSVKERTSATITLFWNESNDNTEVSYYKVYRNGTLVAGHINELQWKDTGDDIGGLEAETIYTYQVTAVDKAENESVKNGAVLHTATIFPSISVVDPAEGSRLCEANEPIYVYFPVTSDIRQYRLKIEYKTTEETTYHVVANQLQTRLTYYPNLGGFSYQWNMSNFTDDQDVYVRYTLYDPDGASVEKECRYELGYEAPAAVDSLSIYMKDNNPHLRWEASESFNISKYRVCRRTEGEEEFGVLIDLPASIREYQDYTGNEGENYEYCVYAINHAGRLSERSKIVTVQGQKDETAPVIKGIYLEKAKTNQDISAAVYATDNRGIVKVFYRLVDSNDSQKVISGEMNTSSASTMITIPSGELTDGIYLLTAWVSDAAGNESGRSLKEIEIDKTAPATPEWSDYYVYGNSVVTAWYQGQERDLDAYRIETKTNNGWTTLQILKGKLYFQMGGLKPDADYRYRLIALDDLGNASMPSEEIVLHTNKDLVDPTISEILTDRQKYNDSIPFIIKASDNYGIDRAEIWYSLDGINYSKVYSLKANSTGDNSPTRSDFRYNWDISNIPEGEVSVKFVVYDLAQNTSKDIDGEAITLKYVIDRTPPNTVSDLQVGQTQGSVSLAWNANAGEVKNYRVYKGHLQNGPFHFCANTSVCSYTDALVDEDTEYFYVVTAVDEAGNESKYSNVCRAVVSSDDMKPQIESISPTQGGTLGAEEELMAVATDNAALYKVFFEYCQKDESIWHSCGTVTVSGKSSLAACKWDKRELKENTEYKLRVCAEDLNGNISAYTTSDFIVDLTPPDKPVVETKIIGNGIALNWNGDADDITGYEVYRMKEEEDEDYICLGYTQTAAYTDMTVENGILYRYQVVAIDLCGNRTLSAPVLKKAVVSDMIAPTILLSESMTGIVGRQIRFDGTGASDNEGIVSYEWDFGDGYKTSQCSPKHVYQHDGVYVATLSAWDGAGNSSKKSILIEIGKQKSMAEKRIRITDDKGDPVPYAFVAIKETGKTIIADQKGEVVLASEPGEYHIAVTGAELESKEYTIGLTQDDIPTDNGNNYLEGNRDRSKDLCITVVHRTPKLVGDLTAKKMTWEEMKEAGIDMSDPANYNTASYEVTLVFDKEKIPYTFSFNVPETEEKIARPGKYYPVVTPRHTEVSGTNTQEMTLITGTKKGQVLIVLPSQLQTISWLKNMYDVKLSLMNPMAEPATVENLQAELIIPKGLTLTATQKGQSEIIDIGQLPAGATRSAEWFIRGDKEGDYRLESRVRGNLPDTTQLRESFYCDLKVEPQNTKGLHLYIMPENKGYSGEDYYVQYRLVNESDETFYQVKTQFGQFKTAKKETVVEIEKDGKTVEVQRVQGQTDYYMPSVSTANSVPTLYDGDSIISGVFKPGDSIYGTYVTTFPEIEAGKYGEFSGWMMKKLQESNPDISISVKPINGHLAVARHSGSYLEQYKNQNTTGKDGDKEEKSHGNSNKGNGNAGNAVGGYSPTKPESPSTDSSRQDGGDPVDLMTGAFHSEQTVMAIGGSGEIDFVLKHNSMLTGEESQLGKSWYHDFEAKIVEENGLIRADINPYTSVTFMEKRAYDRQIYGTVSGNTITLLKREETEETEYIQTGENADHLLTKSDNRWELVLPCKDRYYFDESGILTEIKRKNGQRIRIADTDSILVISDALSEHSIIGQKDEEGRIISLTDPAGKSVSFTYVGEYLTEIHGRSGNEFTYEYDDFGRIKKGFMNKEVFVENSYDEKGRVLEQDDGDDGTAKISFTYQDDEQSGETIIEMTDRKGGKTTVRSDAFGNGLSVTDSVGGVSTYSYDKNGNMIFASYPNGRTIIWKYDEKQQITQETDSSGMTEYYEYDERGNITAYENSSGLRKEYEYDETDHCIKKLEGGIETRYIYDDNGLLLCEEINGRGKTEYTYEEGQLRQIIWSDGTQESFGYDEIGNVTSHTDAIGNVTTYSIDATGNVTEEIVTDLSGKRISGTNREFDASGNMIRETDAEGNVTSYTYDREDNLIAVTRAEASQILYERDVDGNIVKVSYPDGESFEEAVYDTAGNLKKVTDTLRNVTAAEYNTGGNLLMQLQADGGKVKYAYFDNGLLKSRTDGEGNTISY